MEAGLLAQKFFFDLDKREYYIEVDRIDNQGRLAGSAIQESITEEEHKLTPDMVDDLTTLLKDLNDRQRSRVSIYKSSLTEVLLGQSE